MNRGSIGSRGSNPANPSRHWKSFTAFSEILPPAVPCSTSAIPNTSTIFRKKAAQIFCRPMWRAHPGQRLLLWRRRCPLQVDTALWPQPRPAFPECPGLPASIRRGSQPEFCGIATESWFPRLRPGREFDAPLLPLPQSEPILSLWLMETRGQLCTSLHLAPLVRYRPRLDRPESLDPRMPTISLAQCGRIWIPPSARLHGRS